MITFIRKFVQISGAEYLLYLIIILIPFSIRYVFDTQWSFQTGAYSDFTSLSLYISDLVLLALIGFTIFTYKKVNLPKAWKITAFLSAGWLMLEFFLQNKELLPIQAYFSIRIIFLMIFAVTVSQTHVSREKLAWLFTILGFIQSLIAAFQFYAQKSVGLYILGESHLGPDLQGVAKIVSHGTKLIRSYGTFPHSNLLAAFLVCSTLFNLYLLTNTQQKSRGKFSPRGIFLYLTLFLNIFGIFLTFSRAGMLAFAVSAGIFLIYSPYIKGFSYVSRAIPIILASILLSIAILFPYLSTRATISDSAVKERGFYNLIGQEILKDKPIFGIGPGTSVLHMKQYAKNSLQTELESWQIQPVHNYYLISWVEWGFGAILLMFLLIYPLVYLLRSKKDTWNIILVSLGTSFLVLFLFDHYFYTIWPTQLLLWLLVGLNLAKNSSSHASRETESNEAIYDTASQQ